MSPLDWSWVALSAALLVVTAPPEGDWWPDRDTDPTPTPTTDPPAGLPPHKPPNDGKAPGQEPGRLERRSTVDTRVTDTTEATAAQMYRTLAAAMAPEAGLPDPLSASIQAWRRRCELHARDRSEIQQWCRWWGNRGVTWWEASASHYPGRYHHYLTGQWRGWTISLTWIVTPTTCPCGAPAEAHRQHDGTTTVVCAATQSREEQQ